MSQRKNVSIAMSMFKLGTTSHSSSSQWKAMIAGVTMAVYSRAKQVDDNQKIAKGEYG